MIQIMQCQCLWCHRTIHAVKVRKEYVASCGVCQDSFVVDSRTVVAPMPELSTERNYEDGDGDE